MPGIYNRQASTTETMVTRNAQASLLITVGALLAAAPLMACRDSDGKLAATEVTTLNPIVACEGLTDAGTFTFQRVAVWKDDARAAYSMIHDDVCGPALRGIDKSAVPALARAGLTAAMGPFVEACERSNLWDMLKQAEGLGNEIINHSWSHSQITAANMQREVVDARAELNRHIKNPATFFIFPYDVWTAETLLEVQAAGHIGARAGSRDDNDGFDNPPINLPEPVNDMEVEFDVWPRTYSKYALFQPEEILSVHVWSAIDRGGWAMREFHSVSKDDDPPLDGSQGFGPVPLSTYQAHLDFLVTAWQENLVWTSTPSTIIRYRHARTACTAAIAGRTITYDTSSPECTAYATPISVIVTSANDVPSVQAVQGDNPVQTRKIAANTFSITADPTLGSVELSGCLDEGHAVRPGPSLLPARPQPSPSVCDLEQVSGDGSDGQMDDLEREPGAVQVFPNPRQRDHRTGSWTWYPVQWITAGIVQDGANRALHFSGTDIGAFAGATLAFLGGNGSGACYDATRYQGLRFRIKGTATSTDALNGKIVVTLITAETQTRKFGGDLVGEGGHFNTQVSLTADWQTISLPWIEFDRPSWGATTEVAGLALTKMQAIDWSVSDMAASFEVFVDDIELY